jgi:two-component system OmpR family response regulator
MGCGRITENRFDAIILDIMRPGLSGYEVLRRVRAAEAWTPVLMLAANYGDWRPRSTWAPMIV